jgi:hypothetical protein
MHEDTLGDGLPQMYNNNTIRTGCMMSTLFQFHLRMTNMGIESEAVLTYCIYSRTEYPINTGRRAGDHHRGSGVRVKLAVAVF